MHAYFLTVLSSVVAMTKKNANAALVYSFLYKIVQVRLFPGTLVQISVLKPVINPPSLIELLLSDYLQFKLLTKTMLEVAGCTN